MYLFQYMDTSICFAPEDGNAPTQPEHQLLQKMAPLQQHSFSINCSRRWHRSNNTALASIAPEDGTAPITQLQHQLLQKMATLQQHSLSINCSRRLHRSNNTA
jgi:hypothetical protein